MKTLQQFVYCSRCGDELSADEIPQMGEPLCAFCDNMRIEALHIHEQVQMNDKPNTVTKLRIIGNPEIENTPTCHSI